MNKKETEKHIKNCGNCQMILKQMWNLTVSTMKDHPKMKYYQEEIRKHGVPMDISQLPTNIA